MSRRGGHPLVPTPESMRLRAAGFAWKRRERVARLRRLTLPAAIREVEELLSLELPARQLRRPEPPARRIILV